VWFLRVEIDLKDAMLERPRQRAYLARYGRADVLFRRDLPIVELNRAVRQVGEVVKKENELSRVTEDR